MCRYGIVSFLREGAVEKVRQINELVATGQGNSVRYWTMREWQVVLVESHPDSSLDKSELRQEGHGGHFKYREQWCEAGTHEKFWHI